MTPSKLIKTQLHLRIFLRLVLRHLTTMSAPEVPENVVSITPLLKRLWPTPANAKVTADEIAAALSHIFTNSLTPVQTGALLTALHFTGLDGQPDVLSKCAQAMRNAAAQIDKKALRDILKKRGKKEGSYKGGLVDLVSILVSREANCLSSVILLVQEVTPTIHSISAQRHR